MCPVPYLFGSGFHVRLVCFVSAVALPIRAEVTRRAWDCCSTGVPRAGVFRSWTRAGSLVFPGHPSHASARLSDPGRTDRTSPFAVLPVLPPESQHRRLQRVDISRLNPGLWHPLPTLHEPRCRCPCKARFRLAGCASAGRVSNPLDRFERFQSTSILLSRTCTTRWDPSLWTGILQPRRKTITTRPGSGGSALRRDPRISLLSLSQYHPFAYAFISAPFGTTPCVT